MCQLSESQTDVSLATCVERARNGSQEAWELLIERFYGDVHHYLLMRTEHLEASEDLTQSTFLIAVKDIQQLRDPQAFPGWLFQIARNEWRMWLRRKPGSKPVSIDELTDAERRQSNLSTVVDAIERLTESDLVLRIYGELPASLREALYLRCVAGFSDRELAQILGISPAAAQKRAYRAEVAFRKRYDGIRMRERRQAKSDEGPWIPTTATSPATS